MPAAFFGHGSPLNTLADNRYSRAWRAYARSLPQPRAILVISAHWYVAGTRLTAARRPRTIHDFNANFPPPLFGFTYPAMGDVALVERIAELAAPVRVERDPATWGIDHGAFSVLAHAFPDADVPVVELSIDRRKPAAFHYDLAQRLGPLRDEGVFIMGSGNIVHNLAALCFGATEPQPWNTRFDADIAAAVERGDREALISYERHPDAALAAPDAEHFVPVIAIAALRRPGDAYRTIVNGSELGSISMRSFALG